MSSARQERRENLVEKNKNDHEYENNFDAGQVKVQERDLHRTGIRGRKIWLLIGVLVILLIICIINLVILAVMYGVLRIDKDGMKSLSFFDNGIRWTQTSDLETVTVYSNEIGGFKDRDLNIETSQNKIVLHGGPTTVSSQVHVSDGNTTIIAEKGFKFVDPFAEKEIIKFDGTSSQFLQESVTGQDIGINTVVTHRIVSNEHQNLTIETDKAEILGSEGIKMDGKSIRFDTNGDISITSTQLKTIVFDSENITFNLQPKPTPTPSSSDVRYKLCVCRGTYKVYRVLQNITSPSCKTVENICP